MEVLVCNAFLRSRCTAACEIDVLFCTHHLSHLVSLVFLQALPGLNAAGVGLIVASVFSLTFGVLSVSDFKMTSLCIGIVAFTAVDQLKWFEPAVVVAGGVMGIIAWAGKMM
jgi:chromate transport protein ChrA